MTIDIFNVSLALLGTGDRYQCETCHVEFQGPPHLPPDIPMD